MRYESTKSQKGNVGVSWENQEAADSQASAMDAEDLGQAIIRARFDEESA